jgi:HAD superfamily hydrolase (TIGR01509 family)
VPFDLVIFDCDGVLVDSERLTVGIEARVLTELGWPHTPDEVIAGFMGRSPSYQRGEITKRLGADAAALFDERTDTEAHAVFDSDLIAVPGVEAVLADLRARGVKTCVASSGTHERIRRTLGRTGLLAGFEGRIFSASEVENGKPAPDLFLHAAARMGIEPGRCAVIEDSVYGVRGAVAAGMAAFGFGGGLTQPAQLADAGATVFDAMADLVPLLIA